MLILLSLVLKWWLLLLRWQLLRLLIKLRVWILKLLTNLFNQLIMVNIINFRHWLVSRCLWLDVTLKSTYHIIGVVVWVIVCEWWYLLWYIWLLIGWVLLTMIVRDGAELSRRYCVWGYVIIFTINLMIIMIVIIKYLLLITTPLYSLHILLISHHLLIHLLYL